MPYRIGFDLDGVLALTPEAIYPLAHERGWLLDRAHDEQTAHNLEDAFPHGIAYEQVQALFEDDFFLDIPPCGWLTKTFRNLHARGHEIHIVTARKKQTSETTRAWLLAHNLHPDSLTFTDAEHKADLAVRLKLDFFIEDHPETALACAKARIPTFLIHTSYRQQNITHKSLATVHPQSLPLWCLYRASLSALLIKENYAPLLASLLDEPSC